MAEFKKDIKSIDDKLTVHAVQQEKDINRIIASQDESLTKIETMFVDAMNKKADKDIVDKIQADIRWVVYIIIGCVITGIIGFVFFK